MNVFLLHAGRDAQIKSELRDEIFAAMLTGAPLRIAEARRNVGLLGADPAPATLRQLIDDLELETLWGAMAASDEFIWEVVKRVTLSSLTDPEEIAFRQAVLGDCLREPTFVRELYALVTEALDASQKAGWVSRGGAPSVALPQAVRLLRLHFGSLRRLRDRARGAEGFDSEGFRRFFAMLRDELEDEYLERVGRQLDELDEIKSVLLLSAGLGPGDKGRDFVVRRPRQRSWAKRRFLKAGAYDFTIHHRDEQSLRELEEIRDAGLDGLARAATEAADDVSRFLAVLRIELAFYVGCLNLHEQLAEKGQPVCVPEPAPGGDFALSASGLYDVSLAFRLQGAVVGNDVAADGRRLVMITGANQGGKSTFLRSLGLAQLMMQSGMFTGARSLRAQLVSGIFTHFRREEDATMTGGKLDEELRRMSAIADAIEPGALLLANESFQSTNEREGSEIARQIIRALLEKGVRVLFVTHMYDLAHGFFEERSPAALFLRPQRGDDGARTFKLVEAEPLATSFGHDSYRRVFGAELAEE